MTEFLAGCRCSCRIPTQKRLNRSEKIPSEKERKRWTGGWEKKEKKKHKTRPPKPLGKSTDVGRRMGERQKQY